MKRRINAFGATFVAGGVAGFSGIEVVLAGRAT